MTHREVEGVGGLARRVVRRVAYGVAHAAARRVVCRVAPLALAVAATAALGGCAGVDWNGPMPIGLAAQSALPERGQVSVFLTPDGTAILDGWTESEIGEMAVVREIGARPEVLAVVNRLHRPYHLGF